MHREERFDAETRLKWRPKIERTNKANKRGIFDEKTRSPKIGGYLRMRGAAIGFGRQNEEGADLGFEATLAAALRREDDRRNDLAAAIGNGSEG